MQALKEFANFITLNMANLAATYARLLAENDPNYSAIAVDTRTATGRKLLNAVVDACQQETADPLGVFFKHSTFKNARRWPAGVSPPNPLTEAECLGQMLTPIVTNLEAGKFLWHMLADIRADLLANLNVPAQPRVGETKKVTPPPVSSSSGQPQDTSLLRTLIDSLPDIIFAKDTQGRFVLGNEALRRRLGAASIEDVLGKTDFDFNPPELAEQYRADDQKLLESGKPLIGFEELIYDQETGITGWVSTTKLPYFDENGNIAGVLGAVRDITELKSAQLTLATRIRELNCLNELGRQIEESPAVPELLQWTTERLPAAMQYPELCEVAITYNDRVYGTPEAVDIPVQMTHGLYIGGQVMGRVFIAYKEKQAFIDEESTLLGAVATRLSVYIENRGLLKEMESALSQAETLAQEQTVLNELGQALTVRLTITELLEEVYKQAARLVDTTNFYIGLYDPQNHQIEFRLMVSQSEVDSNIFSISADEGLAGYMIRNQTALLLEDNVQERQKALDIEMVGGEPQSWLGVPIMAGDEVLGIMAVQSFTMPLLYTKHDQDLLTAIANQTAIALQNARQFEQVTRSQQEAQMRLHETQVLQQLAQSLAQTLQTDEVIEAFFEASRALLGADYAVFSLVDQVKQRVNAVNGYNVSADHLKRTSHPLDSNDIMADIIRTGQTELIRDADDPRLDPKNVEIEDVALRIFTPITVRQENIGLVEVGFKENVDIDVEETQVKLLRTLVDQMAVSLENARRYQASQQIAQREQLLREIANTINTGESLVESLPLIIEPMKALVPFEVLTLSTYTSGDPEFTLYVVGAAGQEGNHFGTQGLRLPVDGTCPGWVIVHNAVWLDDDLTESKRFIEDEQLTSEGLVSRMILPLRLGDQVIGTINLASAQPAAFTQEHLTLMWQVADQLASALERNRLFDEFQRRAHREQTIREITDKLRTAPNLKQLVTIATHELATHFSVTHARLELGGVKGNGQETAPQQEADNA